MMEGTSDNEHAMRIRDVRSAFENAINAARKDGLMVHIHFNERADDPQQAARPIITVQVYREIK